MANLDIANTGPSTAGLVTSLISQIQSDARNWASFGFNVNNLINERNFRDEVWNYNKTLNNIIMQREDTAVQRRAADLAAAGINPILAAGGIGANANGASTLQGGQPSGIVNSTQDNFVGQHFQNLQQIEKDYEMQKNEIQAKLELQGKEFNHSDLSDKNKYRADRALEIMKEINQNFIERYKAKNTADLAKANAQLQWSLQQMNALKSMFNNSEVPFLADAWKSVIGSLDQEQLEALMDGELNDKDLEQLEKLWNNFHTQKW